MPMRHATTAAPRHPRRSVPAGALLFVAWAAWATAGLAWLGKPPATPSAETIRRHLRAFAGAMPPPGQAVAFRLNVAGCGCTPSGPASSVPGLRSVDLRDRPAPAALPYALIVFAADDRLVYAGPASLDVCGDPMPAAALVPRLLAARATPPLILSLHCPCPEESST
jgi:hypothetical protein